MIRDSQPDRPALWVLQPLGHLPGRLQDERIRSRGHGFQHPVCPVVDASVDTDFRQITANQREIVRVVRPSNPSYAVHSPLVTDMTAERIAGIGRVGNQPTTADDLHDRRHQTRLRMGRMNFYESCHARILGQTGGQEQSDALWPRGFGLGYHAPPSR